jgi:hypothetical protein
VFGCGEALHRGSLGFSAAVAEAGYRLRADRLNNFGDLDREALDWARQTRRRARSWLLGGAGVFGSLGPLVGHLSLGSSGGGSASGAERVGRVHSVPSTSETVRMGVFDSSLPDVLEIDSGDVVVYPDTCRISSIACSPAPRSTIWPACAAKTPAAGHTPSLAPSAYAAPNPATCWRSTSSA